MAERESRQGNAQERNNSPKVILVILAVAGISAGVLAQINVNWIGSTRTGHTSDRIEAVRVRLEAARSEIVTSEQIKTMISFEAARR